MCSLFEEDLKIFFKIVEVSEDKNTFKENINFQNIIFKMTRIINESKKMNNSTFNKTIDKSLINFYKSLRSLKFKFKGNLTKNYIMKLDTELNRRVTTKSFNYINKSMNSKAILPEKIQIVDVPLVKIVKEKNTRVCKRYLAVKSISFKEFCEFRVKKENLNSLDDLIIEITITSKKPLYVKGYSDYLAFKEKFKDFSKRDMKNFYREFKSNWQTPEKLKLFLQKVTNVQLMLEKPKLV